MRAVFPGFTLVEYLFAIVAAVVLPFHIFVIVIAFALFVWLGMVGVSLVYRKWFEPQSGDRHESA